MKIKFIEFGLLLVTTLFLASPLRAAAADEQDFDDDGVVEEVQEDTGPLIRDDNGEEVVYESPQHDPAQFYFVDHFDDLEESTKRWVKSQAKKDDTAEEIAKYDGIWSWESPQRIVWKQDKGLVLKSKAKHAAIAAQLHKVFTFKDNKPLVVQYEVTLQDGQECGGSYIKLLSESKNSEDLTKFNDKTPYTIMFGPDKCGNDIKMHFIFRHVNPINGTISEKHCVKPKDRLEEPFKDKLPHLYQLVVRPDNTFEIRVDHKIINSGSLLTEFQPPVNPPREIDDPTDKKPADWDEREKIPDPTAVKPEAWDDDAPPQIPDPAAVKPDGWLEEEPEMIPDTTAEKPEDWDTEIDGEWEAPLVDNPICEKAVGCGTWKAPLITNKEYKGKWRAPLIENPNYQGKWAARKVPNPDYFEDNTPFQMTPISAVGLELWSMSSDILFDNLIIADDVDVAREFARKSFDIKRKYIDKESETFMSKIIAFLSENPWAWRIAIVLFGTPLAFSVYRLFSSGGKKDTKSDAEAKKTDAVQEDDASSLGGGDTVSTNSSSSASRDAKQSSPRKVARKSDLDVKEDVVRGAGTRARASSSGSCDTDKDKDSSESVEDVDSVIERSAGEETEETTAKQAGGGARKRRVRKEQS